MDIFSNIAIGLETALTLNNLFYCFLGVFLGTLIGVIPGIGVLSAISMLFPITFYLEPTTALIMLAGIWYGTSYGGNTASILLNIPGTPANAVTCLDGYPMARQGRGGIALLMTTVASFVGGSIGIVLLMLFSPIIAKYALSFGSADYFSLMVLGLVAASTISDGSLAKGLAMVVLGIMFGTVGADIYTGTARFSFGVLELTDAISLIALAMGIFGVSEVIASVRKVNVGDIDPESVKLKAMKPSREDVSRSWFPMLRGSSIGAFFGTLPGTGPSVAAFMAYAVEKRVAKEPERFGKGAIEGIMAPESANNSADQTSFIPTLSLGIPGSPTMALMLGALMIHGIAPGPTLMTDQPSLFWGLIMSFWIGNLLLVILNIPLIGVWVRLLTIPYHLLFPAVLMFICIGTYSVNNSAFEVWLVVFFGFAGYLMRIFNFPAAPLLLGFVLGPLMEEHFRRAMLMSRGSFSTFIDRPISATVLAITASLLVWGTWSAYRRRNQRVLAAQTLSS
ncbi:tripartite tricarboxylate transporter permease [Brucella pseudogrignonensis]|uniref:tripartite tricarboxylate transporter permease n=1 Tax=Brucella pseudogrignonensis TaxID=419475 RepID=UPI00190AC9E0|nr:tripartite tricarboxylate transporter permease [Brucella pseudogrignonensis]MBK0023144.1 tripartite tricarboxylate transporter permease [Ochrobactrum sp. S45]MBK0045486.1 tripartite tricarboxylate transporter permease [Ochrobactrum sp. S46]UKK94866.1 tripartite tricarboxylate transporter permease [Brucella pseudogrignonensis]